MAQKKRKRKSSTVGTSSTGDYSTKKTFESDGASLPAIVAGMVTTLLALMLTWSHFSTPQATARFLADAKTGVAYEEAVGIGPDDFDQALESGDASQLNNILDGLNDWPRKSLLPVQISSNRRRVEVANKMLTMTLSEPQRENAIESSIDALSVIYGLDFLEELNEPNVAETLRATAKMYLEDANSKIALSARLAMLKHDSFELTKLDYQPNMEPIAKQVLFLFEKYPDDDTVLATIQLIVDYYNKRGTKVGLDLISKLQVHQDKFTNPKVLELMQRFSDETAMLDVNYSQLFNDKWINGIPGQRKLFETSIELLADPDRGPLIVSQVDAVTHWFEQNSDYSMALEIYDQMLRSADRYKDPKVAELARETATNGARRSRLVGQTVELNGLAIDGSPIRPDQFSQKVVVVIFWSLNDMASRDSLKQIYEDSPTWPERGIEIIGFCVDREHGKHGKQMTQFLSEFPNAHFAIRNPQDNQVSIFDQCPSRVIPRVMLVDRNGLVSDVNVPILEVKTDAEFLAQ